VKGNSSDIQPPERRPAALLALGFTVSAVALYAALWQLGEWLIGPARSSPPVILLAAAVLGLLLAVDARRARRPGVLGPSWRRQTPKEVAYDHGSARAALLWGLDAGLVVTTYRVTSLSWAALTVAFLGLVPWWSGLAYALGFAVPMLVAILVVPRRADPTGRTDPEPVWLMDKLADSQVALKVSALLVLAGSVAGCLLLAARF
jgi:hypothetical protein